MTVVRWFLMMLCLCSVAQAAELDPQQLLQRSDQARGGGFPGLVWEVRASNRGSQANEETQRLLIKANDNASLAETLEPLRSKGAKMLQVERNMWLSKPGLKKPVPISARQRLTGQAAIGDIAATNYRRDYQAQLLREEPCQTERCYVLELTAANRQATYDKVLYWISVGRGVGVKAEFYSLSGKLLKSATFEYNNRLEINGRAVPFVSRMIISDALTDAGTTLEYSQVVIKALAAAEFDVSHLE